MNQDQIDAIVLRIDDIALSLRGPNLTHDEADQLRAAVKELSFNIDIADRLE